MSLLSKQLELLDLLRASLPFIPAESAQEHVDWYKQWEYGEAVKIGDRRWTYVEDEPILYEVYSPAGDNLYPPDQVPAVWKRVFLEEWPEWIQPTGAHDAYAEGAKVTHNGKKWTSDVNANVWEPGVYGWTEYVENA